MLETRKGSVGVPPSFENCELTTSRRPRVSAASSGQSNDGSVVRETTVPLAEPGSSLIFAMPVGSTA